MRNDILVLVVSLNILLVLYRFCRYWEGETVQQVGAERQNIDDRLRVSLRNSMSLSLDFFNRAAWPRTYI